MTSYTVEAERTHRFILALRMGLPIFLLSAVSIFILFSELKATLSALIFLSFILLAMAIYFIFFLINQSTYENITENVTYTFTPEYFYKYYQKYYALRSSTIVLITINNLTYINEQYGVKNGDKVLAESLRQINEFFSSKNIKKLPVSRHKGGDFFLLLKGEKESYIPTVELFLAKYQENRIDDIEVHYNAVILDNKYVKKIDEIITRLYEIEADLKNNQNLRDEDTIVPEELQKSVLEAIEYHRLSIATQKIVSNENIIEEASFKLIDKKGDFIHQSRFIPLLHRIGKIAEYEKYILESMIEIAGQTQKKYAFSLSPSLLRNGVFFQYALELLQRYPKAKNKIIIVMDEKEYSPHIKRFREQIAQYRAVGYEIALDRFGGNPIAMTYLKELDVDYVRFDPLFSRHIQEKKYQYILEGLNTMAHLNGIQTWISMIEDEASDTIVERLKIDIKQGNFHGRITPIKPNEVIE